MKTYELLLSEEQQLIQEFKLKHAIAAAGVGAAMMGNPMKGTEQTPATQQVQQTQPAPAHVLPAPEVVDPKQQAMAEAIAKKYRVDLTDAQEIVKLAHKYEKANFPKAEDILAVIGVESSFDPDAVSGLRRDPAVGLMQVRPKIWNINRAELEGNIEKQIAYGSDILHLYYKKLRHKDAALAAYNVGMSEFRSGNNAEGYVAKVQNEKKQFAGVDL